MVVMPRPRPGFLELPLELRISIYGLVLQTYRVDILLEPREEHIAASGDVQGYPHELTRVCKHIRRETRCIKTDAQLFLRTSRLIDDLYLHAEALPFPEPMMNDITSLTVEAANLVASDIMLLLRRLPRLKRIEVDLGKCLLYSPIVEFYFSNRFGIHDIFGNVMARTDIRCKGSWEPEDGRNIFLCASDLRSQLQDLLREMKEDVIVMGKYGIVAYTDISRTTCACSQPCNCPLTTSYWTTMDLVRIPLLISR